TLYTRHLCSFTLFPYTTALPICTDAGRAVQLVPGEGIEVTIQRLDVDCLVSHRLGTVDQHYGAGLMCQTHDLGDGINRTKRIGHVTYANEPRPFIQKFGVSLHIELAVVRNRDHANHGACLFRHQLPRHDIGMVLHTAEQNFVASLELAAAPARRHQIDGFRGTTGEYDLVDVRGVKKRTYLLTAAIVQIGTVLR